MWDNLWTLISSEEMKSNHPLTKDAQETVIMWAQRAWRILSGEDPRKLFIVWPCSADFLESLEKYAEFIANMREKYSEKIEIIIRYYTWKPRTVWGWKGNMTGWPGENANLNSWLQNARRITTHLLNNYWVPLADEMLHPNLHDHFDDLYSYLAVWARSTENQYHREVASWLEISTPGDFALAYEIISKTHVPAGMKNPVDGDIERMINSVRAAQTSSDYTLGWTLYTSAGNPMAHGILRGWNIPSLSSMSAEERELVIKLYKANTKWVYPNYDLKYIRDVHNQMLQHWAINTSLIVDAKHDNSGKDPNDVKKWLSLTDSCLGKDETEKLIAHIAENS